MRHASLNKRRKEGIEIMEKRKFVLPAFKPPKLITGISENYNGPVREYKEKELWFATEPFGGALNAASIMKSNGGGATFPIDRFINSKEYGRRGDAGSLGIL